MRAWQLIEQAVEHDLYPMTQSEVMTVRTKQLEHAEHSYRLEPVNLSMF